MNRIWMKKPAGWPDELWRESLPMGNGLTSALLCGSVGCEHLWLNRYDRWEGGFDGELPDVSDTLEKTRTLMERGEYAKANGLLSRTLAERGYRVELATPMAPVEIRLRFESEAPFSHYCRGVDLDTGEAFARFQQGGDTIERRAFVSRADDIAVLRVASTGRLSVKIDTREAKDFLADYSLTVDGRLEEKDGYYQIWDASSFTLRASFGHIDAPARVDYDALLSRHLPLYRAAMGTAELSLGGGDHNTEFLLDEAAEEEAGPELYEKLWRFGRYLFVSGAAENGLPFALYGLWPGRDKLPWAQNVANENVQMIYWHAPAGGLAELLRPLIHYYFGKMDDFREAARKLFGCRGIFVSVYTTPMNSRPAPNVPVIVNYIGSAGWLCRHFYDYYRYTGDEALLKAEILPFMMETAAFYEDYVARDAGGKIRICPSVSPENTPGNFMPEDFQEHMGHVNPAVWNSTMDFAILKELLTHLLALNEKFPQEPARVSAWRAMLEDLPAYQVNGDGALKEWMDEGLSDFYGHRHLSHLYPLFPGEEIRRGHPLFDACARAVDLRQLGAASGWALAHQAAIYARLGRGDQALSCLNILAKGCLLPNLFTLHNDWRDMGVTLRIDMAPVQLDALMGAVNAVQEILLDASEDRIDLLPACPRRFAAGSFRAWRFPGGQISAAWNRDHGTFSAEIAAERDVDVVLRCPDWAHLAPRRVRLKAGEAERIEAGKR